MRITNIPTVNKLISTKEDSIDGVSYGKVIVEAKIVGKKFGTGLFTPGARLAFVKLR